MSLKPASRERRAHLPGLLSKPYGLSRTVRFAKQIGKLRQSPKCNEGGSDSTRLTMPAKSLFLDDNSIFLL